MIMTVSFLLLMGNLAGAATSYVFVQRQISFSCHVSSSAPSIGGWSVCLRLLTWHCQSTIATFHGICLFLEFREFVGTAARHLAVLNILYQPRDHLATTPSLVKQYPLLR